MKINFNCKINVSQAQNFSVFIFITHCICSLPCIISLTYFHFRCQNVLLDNMKLGPNIAKNAALRENIFMMAICIELRIPLFLVGKPGTSKSLAKSIIQDSMNGPYSHTDLLKSFKHVCFLA